MLSPLLLGASDASEAVEHMACSRVEQERTVDAGFPTPSGSSSVGRRSKARVRCTWKDCGHREPDADQMRWVFLSPAWRSILLIFSHRKHAVTHRQCPKEDCSWATAKNQKDKTRHVWYKHRAWAESTGYPPMSAQCDECPRVFAREDGVNRHKKEVHGAVKRVRRSGG